MSGDEKGESKDDISTPTSSTTFTVEQLNKQTIPQLHDLLSSHGRRVKNKSKCRKGELIDLIVKGNFNWSPAGDQSKGSGKGDMGKGDMGDDKDSDKSKSKSEDDDDDKPKPELYDISTPTPSTIEEEYFTEEQLNKMTEEQLSKMTKDKLHLLLSSHGKRVNNKSRIRKGEIIELIVKGNFNWRPADDKSKGSGKDKKGKSKTTDSD